MSLLDIQPIAERGVTRIAADCPSCDRPVAVLGLPGKGRPMSTFGADYFCHGHAVLACCTVDTQHLCPTVIPTGACGAGLTHAQAAL
jgi:hypothetical protein